MAKSSHALVHGLNVETAYEFCHPQKNELCFSCPSAMPETLKYLKFQSDRPDLDIESEDLILKD